MPEPSFFLHLELGPALYELRRCSWNMPWQHAAGVYAFVRWPEPAILYIGETANFALGR